MQYNEFKNKLENNTKVKINKSYYKNNQQDISRWQWDASRCRIDICFWVEMILDLITTNKTQNDINEFYLTKTRNITNNFVEYKNSHNMDKNAILEWLNINKKFKLLPEEQVNYKKYYDYIKSYVNDKINSRNDNEELSDNWNKFLNDDIPDAEFAQNENEKIICDICDHNKWKLITDDCWKQNLNKKDLKGDNDELKDNYQFYPKILEELEVIGLHGEQIVNKYLKSKYEPKGWNVQWVSSINPYSDYDFKMAKGDEIIYIEVKSTKSKIMKRFYISNNEYIFYSKNSSKYKLILLANIYETRPGKTVSIFDPNNVEIIISNKCSMQKKDDRYIFSIKPNQFIWSD